jgi:hypothetical protein
MWRSAALVALAAGAICATGCASRSDVLVRMDVPAAGEESLGGYFVDGTWLDDRSRSVIWKLAHRANREHLRVVRYFRGPKLLCDIEGELSCSARTRTVARAICDDLEHHRTTGFVVFGYSRGVWIANKAATSALALCPGPATRYQYGGFLDGVVQSLYLKGANTVPPETRWSHIYRNNTTDPVYPNTLLQTTAQDAGSNVQVPGLSHEQIAKSDAMLERMIDAANGSLHVTLFDER